MHIRHIILGGMLAGVWATAVAAELPYRPHSREDAAAARVVAEAERLTSFRPVARPAHMIRYPVHVIAGAPSVRPQVRPNFVPRTRWGKGPVAKAWARATMSAVAAQGLDSVVPRDIEAWCPAYAENSPTLRRAFWVGMMSALSKHESTYNPKAVGGGGLWYGLLQILPATARGYGCRATTGTALQNPIDNLSCAARIMARTVKRDRAVALHDGRWRGVAADWGPMSNRAKIAEMSEWTRKQDYCVVRERPRPVLRPATVMAAAEAAASARVSTMGAGSFE
ncbi:Transglycosylase SLT domain-containing protein [Loktanella atrilutea]|uniref:Transglycosylase SLT domain-containing protein n=1 Tax=Loktanella atrilutea TaxID=366533 RepID=A0A1M5B5L1_LOKAT|nr:Transglycosylase SLT domain-containing protein [Loktanella atrilutea]